MRVLCATTAGDGHFGPLKSVALACRAAGHDVRVAAPASYARAVGRAGLPHESFPDAPPEVLGAVMASLPALSLEQANRKVMRELFGRLYAHRAFPTIADVLARWRPDVVLREPAEFGSLAAAEVAGVPHAQVAVEVAGMAKWASRVLPEPLAELDALAGLPEGHLLREVSRESTFTMVPASMENALAHTSGADGLVRPVVRYRTAVAAPSEGRLPAAWGDPSHPLVYVTFGTVAGGLGHLAEVLTIALDALAELPVRVLLTTGYAGGIELPSCPPNAHVEKYWPQEELMPSAAVVVGHGGFGTTLGAMSAGVPQVVLPLFTTDQYLNAESVAAMGVGVFVSGGPEAASQLGPAVSRVLSEPGLALRAQEVAREIAALPDLAEVVRAIERLAQGGAIDEAPVRD